MFFQNSCFLPTCRVPSSPREQRNGSAVVEFRLKVLWRTMTTKILHVPKDVNRERATTVFFPGGVAFDVFLLFWSTNKPWLTLTSDRMTSLRKQGSSGSRSPMATRRQKTEEKLYGTVRSSVRIIMCLACACTYMQRTEGGVPPATAPTVQHPTPTVADAAPGTEARRLVWLSGRCACVRPCCGCHGFEVRVIHPNETWHLVLSMYPYFAFRQP